MFLTANTKVISYIVVFILYTGLIFLTGFQASNIIYQKIELSKKQQESKIELENMKSASVSLAKYVEIFVKTENAFTDTLNKINAAPDIQTITVEKTKLIETSNPEYVYVPIEFCPSAYLDTNDLSLFNKHTAENPR